MPLQSSSAVSVSPASSASIARSIVGRDIWSSSVSENQRSGGIEKLLQLELLHLPRRGQRQLVQGSQVGRDLVAGDAPGEQHPQLVETQALALGEPHVGAADFA